MLLGLNEELERAMGEYRRNRNGTEKNSVFNMIAMSLAAGDDWYIPVEMMQDGENETGYSSDRLMEKLPRLVKREVITKKWDHLPLCVYKPGKGPCGRGGSSGDCPLFGERAAAGAFARRQHKSNNPQSLV